MFCSNLRFKYFFGGSLGFHRVPWGSIGFLGVPFDKCFDDFFDYFFDNFFDLSSVNNCEL